MGWLQGAQWCCRGAGFSTPVGGRSAPFQVGATRQIIEVLDTRTPRSRSPMFAKTLNAS